MAVTIAGAGGAVGRAAAAALERLPAIQADRRDVRLLATPESTWTSQEESTWTSQDESTWTSQDEPSTAVVAAPGVADTTAADVVDAGWFGGVGALLADVAVGQAREPAAVHVAYGLPGAVRAWRAVGPSLRSAVVAALLAGGEARVDGDVVAEPVGVGRRLAWFPRPVGPAHAAAVPGHEHRAIEGVATVRTWVAAGSLRSELLQALGRVAPEGRVAELLTTRAARPVRAATADLRWAVVAEARDADGQVVRSWANGSDPVTAAGAVLGVAGWSLAGSSAPTPSSVVDLAPRGVLLDRLAALGALRWSVSRQVPAKR